MFIYWLDGTPYLFHYSPNTIWLDGSPIFNVSEQPNSGGISGRRILLGLC